MANKITTDEAQYSAFVCCGENAPNLETVNESNVIQVRNKFLANVAFNGAMSHPHIIRVLQWMSQLIDLEEAQANPSKECLCLNVCYCGRHKQGKQLVPSTTKPVIIGYSKAGYLYINNKGWLVSFGTIHTVETIENYFSRLPCYANMDEARAAHPNLKSN